VIFLGFTDPEKDAEIVRYCADHVIRKVVLFSPEKYRFPCSFPEHEHIEWSEIIKYVFYYRLLQEIDGATLLVINECLRTQNRHELTYNCLRLFLNQTPHKLIFQYLPIIDTWDDFAILFDLDTQSRWKREKIGADRLGESIIRITQVSLDLHAVPVDAGAKTKAAYAREKTKLLAEVRGDPAKDPHNIPRNLYLMSGKAKLGCIDPGAHYIGRNNRFKLSNLQTYKESSYPRAPYTVFEFCHNFLDFSDFLALSRQTQLDVLVADLKVDQWYFERYMAWSRRLRDAYMTLGRVP